MNDHDIARIAHEANRALCEANDDLSQQPWLVAAAWQRESSLEAVRFHRENPTAPVSATHDRWMKERLDAGWQYAPVTNRDIKQHADLVPHSELSPFAQAKDALQKAICLALIPLAKPGRG